MIPAQRRQRPGGSRGVGNDHRKFEATHAFYNTARAPSLPNHDPLSLILPLLRNVRQVGNGRRADCPNGHTQAHGSLAITQGDNGNVLLHCHACHDTPGVLRALGLDLADLFHERLAPQTPDERRALRQSAIQAQWAAALGVLARESTVIVVAAEMLLKGEVLARDDVDRLQIASNRIHDVREVLNAR